MPDPIHGDSMGINRDPAPAPAPVRFGFQLTLRWTCQSCGWSVVLDAPGFAGDGKWHYINGSIKCGPITAQKDGKW